MTIRNRPNMESLKVVVMPTGHGKTTFHGTEEGLVDAAKLVQSETELREKRKTARDSGNWGPFDTWWVEEIRNNCPETARVLMVPCHQLAQKLQLDVLATLVLDEEILSLTLNNRPKSGILNALNNRREEAESGENVLNVVSYEEIGQCLRLFSEGTTDPYKLIFRESENTSETPTATLDRFRETKGKSVIGCKNQVAAAKDKRVDLTYLRLSESNIARTLPLVTDFLEIGHLCGCKIAENGLIDPILCSTSHKLSSIPLITRWCSVTIDIIRGGHYLHGWSGWAAPSVMKLLGRWPTASSVLRLWTESNKSAKHQFKLKAKLVGLFENGDLVFDIYFPHDESGGSTLGKLLQSLPKKSRVGGL